MREREDSDQGRKKNEISGSFQVIFKSGFAAAIFIPEFSATKF